MSIETPSAPGAEAGIGGLHGRPNGSRRRWVIVAGVAVLAIAVLAAGIVLLSDDEPERSVAPAVSILDRERQPVTDAVLGYYRAAHNANDPLPDPGHPELMRYATGRALESLVNASRDAQRKGIAARRPPNSRAQDRVDVVSVDGNTATVRDCSVDDGLVVETATGRVLDADVVTKLVTVFLVKEGGQWKVSATDIEQQWDGVAGCAA